MAICDLCGNNSEHPLEIKRHDTSGTFDSFECAIHDMAPRCAHCECRIIGHPIYMAGTSYCCDHCAEHATQQHDTVVPETGGQPSTVPEYDDVYPG